MQAHLSLRQCLEDVWRALRYEALEAPACRKVRCALDSQTLLPAHGKRR
jgi:hypothetical protein